MAEPDQLVSFTPRDGHSPRGVKEKEESKAVKALTKQLDEEDRRVKREARRQQLQPQDSSSGGGTVGDGATRTPGSITHQGLKRTQEEKEAKLNAVKNPIKTSDNEQHKTSIATAETNTTNGRNGTTTVSTKNWGLKRTGEEREAKRNSARIPIEASDNQQDRNRTTVVAASNRNEEVQIVIPSDISDQPGACSVHAEENHQQNQSIEEQVEEENKQADESMDDETAEPPALHMVEARLVTEPSSGLLVDDIATAEIVEERKSWIPESNSARLLCFAIILVLAGAIAIGGACGSGACSDQTENAVEREERVRDKLGDLIGFKLNDGGKDLPEYQPYHAALEWILFDDPMHLSSWAENLVQRYVLALFYLQTSQDNPWTSCNPPAGEGDSCIYYKMTPNPDDSHTYRAEDRRNVRWLSGKSECEWFDLYCTQEGDIRKIDIVGQNLTGTLPTEIQYLASLQDLTLNFNRFRGPIPPEYGAITSLESLELRANPITGQVSDSLSFLTSLEVFDPSSTLLTGTIPSLIGRLSNLREIYWFDTKISGSLPSQVGLMSNLMKLLMFENAGLVGRIPSEIGELSLLQELRLRGSPLTGQVPSQMGKMKQLRFAILSQLNLTGSTIPEEFWDMENLAILEMNDCGVGGTLSTNMGKASNLLNIEMSRNEFNGRIPSEIGLITDLDVLQLHHNPNLDGSMPKEVCEMNLKPGIVLASYPRSPVNVAQHAAMNLAFAKK